MTLRIGIAGCGFIGRIHSFAIGRLVGAGLIDARVTTTIDADPSRAAQVADEHGARAAPDLATFVDRADVVWVCTWTAAHRDVVAAAVERDRAVFCEKPLAPTLRECEEVAALLARVPHQVGLVLRHAPVFVNAADLVQSGRYGRPITALLRDDQYFPIQGIYGSDWRADVGKAGGGTLIEHSIHDVDVLRWLLGDPDSVRATTATNFGHPGIDDVAQVSFSFPGGATALLVSIWHGITSRPSTRRLEVFCEEALLWTDDDHLGPLHVETAAGDDPVRAAPPGWVERFDLPAELATPLAQYAAPTKAFVDALVAGQPRPGWPDAATALAAHRLVDAAYRSAAAEGAPEPTGS